LGSALNQFGIRLVIIFTVWTVLAVLIRLADSRLFHSQKLVFRFTIFAYSLTYFFGASIIFLLGETALALYFDQVVFSTQDVINAKLFLLGLIPFGVVLVIAWLPRINFGRRGLGNSPLQNNLRLQTSSFAITFVTVCIIVIITMAVLRGYFSVLLGNALSFGSLTSVSGLYVARTASMSQLNFIQAGILYGMLPSMLAGLVFYKGRYIFIIRAIAFAIIIIFIILNLGLFQIGPISTAFLILILIRMLTTGRSLLHWRYIAVGTTVFAMYSAYSLIKSSTGDSTIISSIFDIVMRMPVAGPYLVDLKVNYPGSVSATDYVPMILGYYMFPELAARNAHISMPQPSFLITWYYYGVVLSATFLLLALMLPFWLSRVFIFSTNSRMDFAQVTLIYSLFHYVYYTFQTSHFETFISSYGVIFPLLPSVIYMFLHRILLGKGVP
jgi:hypothetical protein